jgi:hypothetical protein
MRRSRSRVILGLLAVASLPAMMAVAEERAVRHTAVTCFGNKADWIDIGSAAVPDWGTVSRWAPNSSTPGQTTNPLLCPVTLDVPVSPGTPLQNVKILYSTRENFIPGTIVPATSEFNPTIPSCTVILLSPSSAGVWVQQSTTGGNTGSLLVNQEINVPGSVLLGGPDLNRMLITCQMPKTVTPTGTVTPVPTAMLKAYEIRYLTSPPAQQ